MRIFKTILFVLVLLVGGLLILQCRTVGDIAPSPEDVPGFIPQKAPTNMPPMGGDLASNTVSATNGVSEPGTDAIVLISGSENADIQWTDRNPAARRVSKIFPDLDWMTPEPVLKAGDAITLALFDDAVFEAKLSKVTVYPNGAVGMTAHLTGAQQGTIYLSYSEQRLRASIEVLGGADYAVRYNAENEAHYAIEVDRENSTRLECSDEIRQPSRDILSGLLASTAISVPVAQVDAPAGSTVIDVMVVYTPAATQWASTNGGIETVIGLAMERANEVHTNSNTQTYLRLVHSAEVDYTESTTDPGKDLDRLTYTGGQYSSMDEVHEWRDTYGADLVCLVESTQLTGGLGWLMTTSAGEPNLGFCLARVEQLDWTYTMVHEWGHNMGCSHSKTQSVQPWDNDFRTYSAGWQWADTASGASIGYCSVMTYENFDGDGGNGYEYYEVGYFSNPDITYTGNSTNATGDADDGDNARSIREVRYAIADYRIALTTVTSLPCSNDFEQTFANWVPDGGGASWFRNSGDELNLPTAVNGGYSGTLDAHSGDYFLMFDAANNTGGTAFLDSIFDFSGYQEVSVDFWYHMECSFPSLAGDLTLQVSTNSASTWSNLWSGTVGTGWREAIVDLTAYAGVSNVQVRLRADIGSNWIYTYIMLDDIRVTGVPDPDRDDDGLPNEWEWFYFGSETNANPLALASNGVNTLLEAYIAGINPTNPASFFKTSLTNETGFIVQWSAISGRVYSVFGAANLLDGFLPLETNILWPQSSWTDTVDRSESFYQVDVKLAD